MENEPIATNVEWIVFMITLPTQTEHGFRTDIGRFGSVDEALKACEKHAAERGDELDRSKWYEEEPAVVYNMTYALPDRYYQMYPHAKTKGSLPDATEPKPRKRPAAPPAG